MDNTDHNTRTLLVSSFALNYLLVSRGSSENFDPGAADVSNGRSQVKAFVLNSVPDGGYDFTTDGVLLGYSLRNSVGIAEHPITGGIYAVENSVDNFYRDGVDVHQNNPGEEMNFLGIILNNQYTSQGSNFGYPDCFAAFDPARSPRTKTSQLVLRFQTVLRSTASASTRSLPD